MNPSQNGHHECDADLEVSLDELSRRAAAPEGTTRREPDERRLRCLVTNDDGIDSEGLRVLAGVALEAGLDVVVAAPMREASGASASITAIARAPKVEAVSAAPTVPEWRTA